MTGRFKGQFAVVLGASTPGGMGQAIARRLTTEGALVTVSGLGAEPLAALAAEIGGRAMECDIRDEAQISALIDAAKSPSGDLHIAINAAGVAPRRAVQDFDAAFLTFMAQMHFIGPALFIKYAGAALVAGGAIVNISTMSAYDPLPGYGAYAASKRAGDRIVQAAAIEFAAKRLRINGIIPSFVPSPMSQGAMQAQGLDMAAFAQGFTDLTPLGRNVRVEDIAAMAALLASEEFFETGQIIPCTGGNFLLGHPRRRLTHAASLNELERR